MILQTAGKTYAINKPISRENPKRMYIDVKNANSGEIANTLNVQTATIDGKPLTGYTRVISVNQIGSYVRVAIGG